MFKKIKNILFHWPVLIFITGHCFGQNINFDKVETYINQPKLDSALYILDKIQYDKNNLYYSGLHNYYLGLILAKKDIHDRAFNQLLIAKNRFNEIDSLQDKANANYEIYELLTHQKRLQIDRKPFLNEYIDYAESTKQPLTLARAYSKIAEIHLDNEDLNQSIGFYKKSLSELKKIKDTLRINLIEMNMGGAYNSLSSKTDSAFYYFNKTLPYFQENKLDYYVSINYNNQAKAYENKGDYNNAIEYYEKSNTYDLKEYDIKTRAVYYQNQLDNYYKSGDYKNAFLTADKLLKLNDSIDNESQNNAITEAENKYRASEKEKQNLILQSEVEKEQRQQRNLWIGGIISLLFISITGFLLFKNTKRKQRIAEQEREIEIQKTEKLLKDQELTTIDAMIEGQEKERQRLASDLHDSVGATLSAARLQFEHLQKHKGSLQNEDELFSKTGELLEEAYQEVRSMAHVKNNGVIAKKGLLPAIVKLAKSVSVSNQLKIEVQDFGLTERIDNSLEITIFRIIQELVTNIIKHAEASEASISLTQLEDTINIIVEDNGKGFNTRKVASRDKGMGLSSIEKRVEHLEGSMEVDATQGKGTNILIDIPI